MTRQCHDGATEPGPAPDRRSARFVLADELGRDQCTGRRGRRRAGYWHGRRARCRRSRPTWRRTGSRDRCRRGYSTRRDGSPTRVGRHRARGQRRGRRRSDGRFGRAGRGRWQCRWCGSSTRFLRCGRRPGGAGYLALCAERALDIEREQRDREGCDDKDNVGDRGAPASTAPIPGQAALAHGGRIGSDSGLAHRRLVAGDGRSGCYRRPGGARHRGAATGARTSADTSLGRSLEASRPDRSSCRIVRSGAAMSGRGAGQGVAYSRWRGVGRGVSLQDPLDVRGCLDPDHGRPSPELAERGTYSVAR